MRRSLSILCICCLASGALAQTPAAAPTPAATPAKAPNGLALSPDDAAKLRGKATIIKVSVARDKFAKTIAREFEQDIGSALTADKTRAFALSLWSEAIAPDEGGETPTPTNLFLMEIRMLGVKEPPKAKDNPDARGTFLNILLDGKKPSEVAPSIKARKPSPPVGAQPTVEDESIPGALFSTSRKRFVLGSSKFAGSPPARPEFEQGTGGRQVDGNVSTVGFVFDAKTFEEFGMPKTFELRVTEQRQTSPGAVDRVEIGELTLTVAQERAIRDFVKRIQKGK